VLLISLCLFTAFIAVSLNRIMRPFAVSPVQRVTALEIIGREAACHVVHDVAEQGDDDEYCQRHKDYHHVAKALAISHYNCCYGYPDKHQDVENSRQQKQQEVAHNQTDQAAASYEHHIPCNSEFIQRRDHRLVDVCHERKKHVYPHQYIRDIRDDDDQDIEQNQ